MKNLFQNVIWPAVAGNVAWAFFYVAVQESRSKSVVARLFLLFLLAFYLGFDWLRTASELYRMKSWYWIGDAVLASMIVVAAIATQVPLKVEWLNVSLAAVFLAAVAGHIAGAWEPTGEIEKRWWKRAQLAGISVLGFVLTFTLSGMLPQGSLWHLPITMLLVLILWVPVRKRVYRQSGAAVEHREGAGAVL